ncbi:hypothetical protein P3T25_005207 [Paraburkholderia sp. GAS32]
MLAFFYSFSGNVSGEHWAVPGTRLNTHIGSMKKGCVTLGQVAARASHLDVACTRCERRGRYSLSKLVASHGEDFPLPDLAARISDCPKKDASVWERCDVYYPGLRTMKEGGEP